MIPRLLFKFQGNGGIAAVEIHRKRAAKCRQRSVLAAGEYCTNVRPYFAAFSLARPDPRLMASTVAGSLVVIARRMRLTPELLRLQQLSANRHLQYPLCLQYRDHTSWCSHYGTLTASISAATRLTRCQCLGQRPTYTSLGRGDCRNRLLLLRHSGLSAPIGSMSSFEVGRMLALRSRITVSSREWQ